MGPTIAILSLIAGIIIFECITIAQSKKAHYKLWKQEFERELGLLLFPDCEKVDENIIRELYDETMSPKTAAEHYKEVKGVYEKSTES